MTDFAVTISPRFYETDALGHINNAAISGWFEVVRIRFLESLEEGPPVVDKNWVLASIHLDFVSETFYGSDVSARITGARVGNSSLTIGCEMSQEGRVTVRGEAVLVQFDLQTRRTVRIPDGLRERIGSSE